MHRILSRVFKAPFLEDVYIFFKEEAINIQFLLMLEDIYSTRKKKDKDYCEVAMSVYSLMKEDGESSKISVIARIMKNDYNLKIELIETDKIRMKILDDRGKPFYLRKFDPSISTKEVLINISNWNYGDYNIELTDMVGITIASGKFEIC